jgi:hypothetical protein
MKRRIPVAIAVSAAVAGGLFLLFPAPWVGLLLALVALLTAQWILIRRHTTVVASGSVRPAPREGSAGAAAEVALASLRSPEAAAATTPAAPPPSEVFSRFRSHLESMEQGAAPPAPKSAPAASSATAQAAPASPAKPEVAAAQTDEGDRVVLSAAGRAANAAKPAQAPPAPVTRTTAQPVPATAAQPFAPPPAVPVAAAGSPAAAPKAMTTPQPKPQAAPSGPNLRKPPPEIPHAVSAERAAVEDEEEDLFADLRPALAVGPLARRARGAKVQPEASRRDVSKLAALPPPDEVGAALERARAPEQIAEDGEALLRMAQEALDGGNLPRLKTVLDQYDSVVADAPDKATWQAARLHARLAALEGRAEEAGPNYQSMLERGYAPLEAAVESDIDALLEGLDRTRVPGLKAALLSRALAPFRQAGDRAALNRLYARIEAAAEAADDERRLIQYYKNHLAIREALNDLPGRLELIDKIGNRYYKLQDMAASREYYEMGLKLRAEQAGEKPPDAAQPAEPEPAAGGGGQGRR